MKVRIGIDAGSTSTKLVAMNGDEIIDTLKVRSVVTDQAIYGVFDQFAKKNKIHKEDIEYIHLTGVGASGFQKKIRGIKTSYIPEFTADAVGARFFAKGEEDFVLVSMGTGTTYLHVKGEEVSHWGGLGLGGGTLVGLSKYMLGTVRYNEIYDLSKQGSHSKVNIMLSDVSTNRIEDLPMDITVSNFGKISEDAAPGDIASGLINLVLENIIQTGCLMAYNVGVRTIVLIGGLSGANEIAETLTAFRSLYTEMKFISVPNGSYITAIGAAVAKGQ